MTQIQKIAAQAKASVPQGILGVDKWIEVYNQKFAELIVRECAEVLDTWNKENGAEEGLDKEGLISLWSPHFGVEG